MTRTDEIAITLQTWAPELTESFNLLGYLGSELSVHWLTASEWSSHFELLIRQEGSAIAAEMWRKVLKENVPLPAPALILILEHLRQRPAETGCSLTRLNLEFSKTLANASFRAAEGLYEGAKSSFAGDEIDVGIARFRAALSEFRFCIESPMLSDATRRIATGKYATAVAMIGRWYNVSSEAVAKALLYSKQSMTLGNVQPETVTYRLELLVQHFDQTGDEHVLRKALVFLSEYHDMAEGSELAEAEARLRLALLSSPGSRDARRYLMRTNSLLNKYKPKNLVEEARRKVLLKLVAMAASGKPLIPARSAAIPRGLLSQMAAAPSDDLWLAIRQITDVLDGLRSNRGSIPAAVLSARFLRQMVDGPDELRKPSDVSRYVDVAGWLAEKVSWNRHVQWEAGAAALSAAKRTGNHDLAHKAKLIFDGLSASHSTWPLPRIGIARVQDYLESATSGQISSSDSWREAASLALNSAVYARSHLGGRNEVFAVADARGFMSETFVFKRTTKAKAEHEASMLSALRNEIFRLESTNRFEVPRSLAIVEAPSEGERRWVHVSQRAAGRLVSELRQEEASDILASVVELLAIFHRVAGKAPAGKSAWGSMKDHIKMWSRTLFAPEQALKFVDSLRITYPADLTLVRKRDGHASNWLLDPAGRLVAIDLESSDFIPIGYDVAQLIEDNGLVPANAEGWQKRLAVMGSYLDCMGQTLSKSAQSTAYGWFALTRALRLGTDREAGKQLRRHARELCGMLVECGDETIKGVARELLHALSRVEQSGTSDSVPSHDHRRLSKAMAYLLRHHGPTKGVPIDSAGYASMDELALALDVDSSQLLAVAEHPGEPRFEVREGQIRALYGHSLEVVVEAGFKVGAPASLYHGSSWSAIDAIVRDGLIPMQRRMVHLTNIAEEAMAVAQRKGAPLVFAVVQSRDEEPVAEGIWVAPKVPAQRLSILNPFTEEAGSVR